MEKINDEMTRKSFVIPESFLKEFQGDMRIIFGGSTQGIWIPPEDMEINAELIRKHARNLQTVLVPESFM